MTRLVEYGSEYVALKAELADVEEAVKVIKGRIARLGKALIPEEMYALGIADETGKGSFTLGQAGFRLNLRNEIHVSVKSAQQEALLTYLRDRGDDSLIKETVHPGTLKKYVKELLEDGSPVPEEIISVYHETAVVATRLK